MENADDTAAAGLADALGIAAVYRHADGRSVTVAPAVRGRLAEAMGYPAGDAAQAANSLHRLHTAQWAYGPPPAVVVRLGEPATVPVVVPASAGALRWRVEAEDGSVRTGEQVPTAVPGERARVMGTARERRHLVLPPGLPPGYHQVSIGAYPPVRLIVAPAACALPPGLAAGGRTWGMTVPVYGIVSDTNWGHGNYTDLGRLAELAAAQGADLLSLSPLHALFAGSPRRRCPYAPSSRHFLTAMAIDPAAVPEWTACPALQAAVSTGDLAEALARLRAGAWVAESSVARRLYPVLEQLYQVFRRDHLLPGSARGAAFRAFVADGGRRLTGLARYEALAERHRNRHWDQGPDGGGCTWRSWPARFHDAAGPAVAEFAAAQAERVDFFLWLQFEAERQLAAAAGRARAAGMAIGFARDLAVGFDPDGAEAWTEPALVPRGISVGCPPDLRNPQGQDWGVACHHPHRLRAAAYQPWIDLLRANMRHAGALRIDHAFQLSRLYWIPVGETPGRGGYVAMPIDDLLGILALESQRHQCAVVAEDLGTIPEGFRERIMAVHALSCRILHRERSADGGYRPAAGYPAAAVAALGTHDQATFAGFWTGCDLAVRRRLGLYPSPESAQAARRDRERDRVRLVEALGWTAADLPRLTAPDGRPAAALVLAVHRFLAATPSAIALVNLQDLLGELEQLNLPGTVDQYPNWRRKFPGPLAALFAHPLVRAAAAEMTARKTAAVPITPSPAPGDKDRATPPALGDPPFPSAADAESGA